MSAHIQRMLAAGEPLRLFVTGGSGFVGGHLIRHAVAAGHVVRALSRSEASDATLRAVGAEPVRGDLEDLDVLRSEAFDADGAVHLAYDHDPSKDAEAVALVDRAAAAAINTGLTSGIRNVDKPLVVASALAWVAPDPAGSETDEDAPDRPEDAAAPPLGRRAESERLARRRGSVAVRIAPYAHGHGGGGHSLATALLGQAVRCGAALYAEPDAGLRTSAIHVDDLARLLLAALARGRPEHVYNAAAETDVALRPLAEAVGRAAGVPAKAAGREAVAAAWGPFLADSVHREIRASSRKAREELGWAPQEVGLLDDLAEGGSYGPVVAAMKKDGPPA